MSSNSEFNRRQFVTISGSAVIAGLAGCSGGGGDSTPNDDNSATPTATEESNTPTDEATTSTPTSTEDQSVSETPSETTASTEGYLIDSLSDYRSVANNSEEWVGEQIAANDVSYYQSYQEEYEGFRQVYESEDTARPFMLKNVQPNTNNNREEFTDGERISFEGTVEKIGELQGVNIILAENVTIE
jgi:hypothetical protein